MAPIGFLVSIWLIGDKKLDFAKKAENRRVYDTQITAKMYYR